jgi:hypothetical protein
MTYEEQLEAEKINKDIVRNIVENGFGHKLIDYYKTHTQKETIEEYRLRNVKVLRRALEAVGFDFEYKKHSNPLKGRKSPRSHESYVTGGAKSSATQKTAWQNKSDEEKRAWSEKQSLAHLNSPTFKDRITATNRAYRDSLSEDEVVRQNKMRSEAMKRWWSQFSEKERYEMMNARWDNGAGYRTSDSQPNLCFKELLDVNDIAYNREFRIEKYSYDFKVGNTLVEIDPTATHNTTWSPFGKTISKDYHLLKTECATVNGFRCLHLFDWDDAAKAVRMLGKRDVVYARKCDIREVEKREVKTFINEHHLQNYAIDKVRVGLYHDGELVSVMTFGKPRYNKNYEWELIRFCSSKNVVGGSRRMFVYFVKQYHPTSIVSYCDLSKFSGETYATLGFSKIRQTRPTKHWHNPQTGKHVTDNLLRQRGFDQLFGTSYGKGSSNAELMLSHGFVEVYDCGQATYVWRRR